MIALCSRTSLPVLYVPWLMSLLCTFPLAQSLLHPARFLWTSQNFFSFWHRPHYSSLFIWRSVPARFITIPMGQGWKIMFKYNENSVEIYKFHILCREHLRSQSDLSKQITLPYRMGFYKCNLWFYKNVFEIF